MSYLRMTLVSLTLLVTLLCAAPAWGSLPLPPYGAIGGSYYHTLLVRPDGTVLGFGGNFDGVVGDGSTTVRLAPVPVAGISNVVAAAQAGTASLLLKSDGTVWSLSTSAPQQVAGLPSITSITGGQDFVLALDSTGAVWAWGDNSYGQLGNGGVVRSDTPAKVPGLSSIVGISAGTDFSLAVTSGGTVWAWGNNHDGQLGDGTKTQRNSPVPVPAFGDVKAVSGGRAHALALKNDGTVWAWGYNSSGHLGDGTKTQSSSPVQSINLPPIAAIDAGMDHSLALTAGGQLYTWGQNYAGQLGNGSITDSSTPQAVAGLSDVAVFAGLGDWSMVIRTNGQVLGFGYNAFGNVGVGTSSYALVPVQVPGLPSITDVALAGSHSLARTATGEVYAWGYNSNGELGLGDTTWRYAPAKISSLSQVSAVAAGAYSSFAVKADGSLLAWGSNSSGQLGDGTKVSTSTPITITGITSVKAISSGNAHTLALKTDGTVWSWGDNTYGQLGDNTTTAHLTPAQIPTLSNIVAISTGSNHSLALSAGGVVWAWGSNGGYRLGDNTTTNRPAPIQVSGLPVIKAIAAGYSTSLAVAQDGGLWWFGNYFGTCTSSYTNAKTPTLMSGVTSVASAGTNWGHMLVLTDSGSLSSCGMIAGFLGLADTATSPTAVNLPFPTGVSKIAVSMDTSAAVRTDGSLWMWGNNMNGGIGTGDRSVIVPTPVVNLGTYTVAPATLNVAPAAGSQSVTLGTSSSSTPWMLVPDCSWVSASPAGGSTGASPRISWLLNSTASARTCTLKLGAQSLTVNQAAYSAHQISGRVTIGSNGLAGVALTLNGAQTATATSDAGGYYTFSGLVDGGSYTVTPLRQGYLLSPLKSTFSSLAANQTANFTATAATLPPFGAFETPADGLAGVAGSVAVTGWALDEHGAVTVKIYRDPLAGEATQPNGYVYIGDALFVPGARPDVQNAYPQYPSSDRAGWGYLLLTNYLGVGASVGNGAFRLHAIATDADGNSTELGAHSITVDNSHAVKPFGGMATPTPGQVISGTAFRNWAWALTPQPAAIAVDGSTIRVMIDAISRGNPTYGLLRPDVAALFPSYANATTASGYFMIDTTTLSDGMHTIAWAARDNQSHADGIGSRYFWVQNNSVAAQTAQATTGPLRALAERAGTPGEAVELRELDILHHSLPAAGNWTGCLVVGDECRELPVGSTLNEEGFHWQLGPGFLGHYQLHFSSTDGAEYRLNVRVGKQRR